MKWFADFLGRISKPNWSVEFRRDGGGPITSREVHWDDELFNLCWEREALFVEIDTAKRQKKKSSHLIAALAKNTARRLEIEMAHNGKRA